ncbi:hypothetical protein ACW9KT_19890 [Hymenobacter sp. HD11105]
MESPYIPPCDKVTDTVLAYYRQVDELVITAQELATWFDLLPAPTRLQMHTLGLRTCLTLPAFRRSVLEHRGRSMAAYMAAHLTPDELRLWEESEGRL